MPADNMETKRNRPLNRTVAMVIFGILIAVAVGSLFTPDPKEKAVKKEEARYSMSSSKPNLEEQARPVETAKPPEIPPEVIEEVERREAEERTPPPQPQLRKKVSAQQQQPVSRPQRRSNPLAQQWMQRQRQAFESGTGVAWNTQAENKETAKETDTRERSYIEMYNELMKEQENGGNKVQKSQQQLFFENAGADTKGTLSHTRVNKVAPYVIPAGHMIPCVLITGINSDLPGNLTAQVSENVCDWTNPRAVLIPQGTLVFGTYDSNQLFGQKRILARWTRLTYPDGSILDLEGMPSVDSQGYSGMKDKYNAHYNSMLTAAIIVAGLGAVVDDYTDDNDSVNIGSDSSTVGSEVAEAIGDMGEKIFDKFLNRQPTILIRPGKKFNIQANTDIPFTRAWETR